MDPQHWVDAAYDAAWRSGDGTEDDRDTDPECAGASAAIDAAAVVRIVPQLEALLLTLNTRPISPEGWARYRQAGVLATTRGWGHDPFRWEGADGERGRIAVDWGYLDPLTPRQRARACFLLYLALTNAACDLPNLNWRQ